MKKTPCCRMFTLKEFEGELGEKGMTFDQLVEYSQQIYDWWLETDDMTVQELCDDFLHHFGLVD